MSRYAFPSPPSSISGELASYLYQIKQRLDQIPTLSYFSGSFPSAITGLAADIAVNVSPASNVSRLFIHYGSAVVPDRTSWTTVA